MVITLIGYRCSGKSSVAPRVARRLGWSFVDTDVLIESRAGKTVTEIFESEGESGFRQRESEVLADAVQIPNVVIATGGGAVLSETNRRLMKAAGPVVWLHVSGRVLAGRLSRARSADRRPSLTGKPVSEEVAEVLAVREPLYRECASLIINAEFERPAQVANRIVRELFGHVQEQPA